MADGGADVRPLGPGDPPQVGPYRIVGRLGAGGMGSVFMGEDDAGNRVAVKVVHAQFARDQEFRARFSREVSLLARVRGTCTTPLIAADIDGEVPWFATEFVPGPTLMERVERQGPMHGDDLFALAAGIAEALVALHDEGVIHRDLKPQNLICSPTGPRLLDLGIARSAEDQALTRTGMMIGSPAWMSPERFRGHDSTPAADVYAWAMLVIYAATGVIPFGSGSPEQVALRVLQDNADSSGVRDLGLRAIVDRAANKDPLARPTAREALAQVTQVWRGAIGGAPVAPLDPVADATSLIQLRWNASGEPILPPPGDGYAAQSYAPPAPGPVAPVAPAPPPAPAAPAYGDASGYAGAPARSGTTLGFEAPQVAHAAPPPMPQPAYHPASGTYPAPAQSGAYAAPAQSGTYAASGAYGTPPAAHATPPPAATPAPAPAGRRANRSGGRRGLYIGVAVAVGAILLAAGAFAVLKGGGDEDKGGSAAPTSSGSAPPAKATGPTTYTFQGLKFKVPQGWEVREDDDSVCVSPVDQAADVRMDCARGGLRILPGLDPKKVDLAARTGWTLGDKATCVPVPKETQALKATTTSGRSFSKHGSLTYEYAKFDATCAGGVSFRPQIWWLPQSRIAFMTVGLAPSYDSQVKSIITSLDKKNYKAPK